MQQVLDELLEDRVGDLAPLLAAVVVRLLRQRRDERRQVLLLDGDHARGARERVIDGDAWSPGAGGHAGRSDPAPRRRGRKPLAEAPPPRSAARRAGCRVAAPSSASSLSRNDSIGAPSIAERGLGGTQGLRARRNACLQRKPGCYPQGVQDMWRRHSLAALERAQFAGVVESTVSSGAGRWHERWAPRLSGSNPGAAPVARVGRHRRNTR